MRTSCGQGPQISGLVISHAVLPATKHEANPFEGQGSHYAWRSLSHAGAALVIGTRPNRLHNRVSCPFVKTLPQKLGTRPAKVHPFLLSTALRSLAQSRCTSAPLRHWHNDRVATRCRSWGSVGAALAGRLKVVRGSTASTTIAIRNSRRCSGDSCTKSDSVRKSCAVCGRTS